jgi:hypothetical protein
MSASASGLRVSGSLSALSSVSLNFTRDAEEPGDCGSGVFIAAEVDGVGEQGSGDITMVDVETPLEAFLEDLETELFSSSAILLRFPEEFCCRWFIVEIVLGWC